MNLRIFTICMSASLSIILSGCRPLSEQVLGEDNKMNGSFELVKNDLPVNWYFFSPKIVRSGDFNIIIDTLEFTEGKQSLKFLIRKFPTDNFPGFFQAFKGRGGETYKVSYWLMNEGSSLKVGTISNEYMEPRKGRNDTAIVIDYEVPDWKYFEYYFKIPPKLNGIYFEVRIYKSGSVWFDDIRIEGTENDKSERTVAR